MTQVKVPTEAQVTGILMMLSGAFNMLLSGIWILFFIWICVGVMWVIPLGIGALEFGFGLAVLIGRRPPGLLPVSVVGAINGVLLFSVFTTLLQIGALVLMHQPAARDWFSADTP